jgi:hypothetical protein
MAVKAAPAPTINMRKTFLSGHPGRRLPASNFVPLEPKDAISEYTRLFLRRPSGACTTRAHFCCWPLKFSGHLWFEGLGLAPAHTALQEWHASASLRHGTR